MINKIRRFIYRTNAQWGGVQNYWNRRYKAGGNSGAGSYGRLAEFKAEVINDFVNKHMIHTVIEWGCGDGNQLSLAQYPEYIGFDVSMEAVKKCRRKFKKDKTKKFIWNGKEDFINEEPPADLSLSLDVLYHLIEDDIFDSYMRNLFDSSDKYVIIYSCDFDKNHATHVRCRKFSDWINQNMNGKVRLLKIIKNKYPYDENDPNNTSWSDFYIYKKI